MRTRLVAGFAILAALLVASAQGATMTGWDVGWNDMATISGGTVTLSLTGSGALEYVNIEQANVSFSTADFFDGFLAPYNYTYSWATATGDQGQHYFDGAIRNSWYDGAVPTVEAREWNGDWDNGGEADGSYEWLLNNYAAGTDKNPSNSWIRGTDSSFTYNETTGEFVADLTSDGIWYWYDLGTSDSLMSGWIQGWLSGDTDGDFADYYGRYMTGNFRLVGTFGVDTNNLPVFTNATLQYEVAVVPLPGAAGLGLLGLGLVGYMRRRKSVQA